jgi:hypothetical protein
MQIELMLCNILSLANQFTTMNINVLALTTVAATFGAATAQDFDTIAHLVAYGRHANAGVTPNPSCALTSPWQYADTFRVVEISAGSDPT